MEDGSDGLKLMCLQAHVCCLCSIYESTMQYTIIHHESMAKAWIQMSDGVSDISIFFSTSGKKMQPIVRWATGA